MDTLKAYYIMVNEAAYTALCERYLTEDVSYIFSAGMNMVKDFQLEGADENILSAYLWYFSSVKSTADNAVDLRNVGKLSNLETAEILKDVLLEKETDVTTPILITTRNDEVLKTFFKKQKVR